ncbi:MAG: DNA methyltransferase [Chloroflexi bacterium RBG_16_52_11]|nr:MAG: DNA methyltransferase [Chloroflexi bacterium RBG_16_52_11]
MADEPSELRINQIIQGDCVEVLAGFPPGSVDLVFADPPYNLQLNRDLWRPNMTRVAAVSDAWDKFAGFTEYDDFTRSWLGACRRVLKDSGTIWVIGTYHNIYRVGAILQDLGFWILNDVVWIKLNPMPNFRGVRFTNAQETLIWAQKVRGVHYTFNHRAMKALNDDLQMRSDWHLPVCNGRERVKENGKKAHTTQKPEALLYRVLLSSTNPGDVVLDPFFGTGTTGAVARKLGRQWIGIEREPRYVQLAEQRIRAVAPGDDRHGVFDSQPALPRIAFGMLLEVGLLSPGQSLYFNADDDRVATLLPDGHLRYGEFTGSIHQVGRRIMDAPCNGWDHWYYQDAGSGERQVIDGLRQVLRDTMR